MAEKGVIFPRADAEKIRAAVREVLGAPTDLRGRRIPYRNSFTVFPAVVTNTGPEGDEVDYTDERYWVRRSLVDDTDSETLDPATPETHITTSYFDDSDGDPVRFTATNLFEGSLDKEMAGLDAYQSGRHQLAIGTRVLVFGLYDAIGNVRYVMFPQDTLQTVGVLITGPTIGGGVYTGKLIKDPSVDFDVSGGAADDALGDIPDDDDCFIVNMAESGQATHDLTDGSPNVAVFLGVVRPRKSIKCDADGTANPAGTQKHVVIINGVDWQACAPAQDAPLHI